MGEPAEQIPVNKSGGCGGRVAGGCGVLVLAGFLWFLVFAWGMGQADSGKQVSGWVDPLISIIPVAGIIGVIVVLLRPKK